ncbi:MAG: alpha/beta fold hydrolase [Acetobacteraceae bacterium]
MGGDRELGEHVNLLVHNLLRRRVGNFAPGQRVGGSGGEVCKHLGARHVHRLGDPAARAEQAGDHRDVVAAGLRRPIVLGASMSGEICLELALRHPDAFGAIIACEACEQVPRRFTAWPSHPEVNQGFFIPEWIHGLSAPQSPAECVAAIDWHYAQGGPGVFTGDIAFYAGDWDARERVHLIDGDRARLHMLTGEYDYSCTVEMSAATAAKIPGARFQAMPGIGHFPFAENPALFAEHLLPILEERKNDRDHA